MLSYLSEEQSKRALIGAFQSVWAVKDVSALFDFLRGIKTSSKAAKDQAPEMFDPSKATDEERVAMYEKIITGVMGKEFYESVVK